MTVLSTLDITALTANQSRAVMDELGVEARPEGGIYLHLTTPASSPATKTLGRRPRSYGSEPAAIALANGGIASTTRARGALLATSSAAEVSKPTARPLKLGFRALTQAQTILPASSPSLGMGAKRAVERLIEDLGAMPVDAGPLTSARYIEPAMMLLVSLAYAGEPRDIGLRLLERTSA